MSVCIEGKEAIHDKFSSEKKECYHKIIHSSKIILFKKRHILFEKPVFRLFLI